MFIFIWHHHRFRRVLWIQLGFVYVFFFFFINVLFVLSLYSQSHESLLLKLCSDGVCGILTQSSCLLHAEYGLVSPVLWHISLEFFICKEKLLLQPKKDKKYNKRNWAFIQFIVTKVVCSHKTHIEQLFGVLKQMWLGYWSAVGFPKAS